MKNKNFIFISLLLLIGGGGAYYFWKKSKQNPLDLIKEAMKYANARHFSSLALKKAYIENIYEIIKSLAETNTYDNGKDLFDEANKMYNTPIV